MTAADGPPPGAAWHPDPTGRYEQRWWDGAAWTATVARGGQTFQDPAGESGGPAAPGGRRSPAAIAAVVATAVLALVVGLVVATRDSDDDTTVGAGTSSITVGSDGGRILLTLEGGDGQLALEVPPGALPSDTEISIGVEPGPGGRLDQLAAGHAGIWTALGDYALDDPDTLAHPLFGPFLLATGTELVGPELTFGPDGLALDEPALLELPLSATDFPPGTEPVVLHEGVDGWEVLPHAEVDEAEGVLRVEVPHFSRSVIGRILSNIWSNPTASVTREQYRAALDTLAAGPADEVSDSIVRGALCSTTPVFNQDNLAAPGEVLDYLGFEGPRIGRLPQGAGNRIRDQLIARFDASAAAGNREPHDVTLQQLLGMAMAETGNDVFQALTLAHDVLRDNRDSPRVQGVMENVRGDGGDERGARYHLLGTALYSFAYEHLRATGQLGTFWPPSAEMVVSWEEAWVSGDIRTDTVEYAVDRLGARLGRNLYREFRTLRESGAASEHLQLICGTTSSSSSSTTTSTLPTDIDLGGGDVQITLQWRGDADMDLHVTDPSGEEIYFGNRSSASGGQLDHDDIPSCGTETGDHVENIFWPVGGAPTGQYRAWVRNYRNCTEGGSQTAQLSVRVNGQVVHTEAVTLPGRSDSAAFSFTVR